MKVAAALLVLAILGALLWFLWRFQPFMAPGQAVHLSTWRLGDTDFQVWQRRNSETTEPFATALFVRRQSGPWQAFCLDFEDLYAPRIVLARKGGLVVVFHRGKELGALDESRQIFTRESDAASFKGAVIDGEPPGDWWLK